MTAEHFVIDKRFSSSVERSPRVLECAEAFGLGLEDKEFVIYDKLAIKVKQGDVVYITGQSGSGKSLLLKELAGSLKKGGKRVQRIEDVLFEDRPLIDQVGKDTDDAIRILGLAGLNDAYLFIRKPKELSDGQRYRFALAKLMESSAEVWVADEFGAVLDRTTAKVVAFSMQKFARKVGATLIVATTHKDLRQELAPNVYVDKEYKSKIKVEVEDESGATVGEEKGAAEGKETSGVNRGSDLRKRTGLVIRPGSGDSGVEKKGSARRVSPRGGTSGNK